MIRLLLLAALAVLVVHPARAQLFGARPGYSNATLNLERKRTQARAALVQAQKDQAAKIAAEQEAAKAKK